MGFREFQEIRGFRGLNSRLRVVDSVDCVYGVSIWVNVNDGNNVGKHRAICQTNRKKQNVSHFPVIYL